MTDAYVVAAGQSPFGVFPDETYRSLFDNRRTPVFVLSVR